MIDRSAILAVAGDLSLAPDMAEKDHVLGRLLAEIYSHPQLAPAWTFKGGTCLKKCHFETCRFSEDLDFTTSQEAPLDSDFPRSAFSEISGWICDQTGPEIPVGPYFPHVVFALFLDLSSGVPFSLTVGRCRETQ